MPMLILGEGNGNPLQYPCLQKSHGQRSLVGYSLWCRKESDMTEQLSTMLIHLSTSFPLAPLVLYIMLCYPRFFFHVWLILLDLPLPVNFWEENIKNEFNFKHKISVINGQKKLYCAHWVHPVGLSRLTRVTDYPILPFFCDLYTYRCGECWNDSPNQNWFSASHTHVFLPG